MSLLLKALQNAAKNREAGAAGQESAAATNASSAKAESPSSGELSLEPIDATAASADSPPSRSEPSLKPRTESKPVTPRGTEQNAMANRTRAQNVFLAGAGNSTTLAEESSPGIVEWLTRRPIVAFSTAAGLFAIGYGVYLYLQLTNPGLFIPRQGPVASPPPVPAPVAQAPSPPIASVAPPIVTEPTPGAAPQPAPGPGAVATPMPTPPAGAVIPSAPPSVAAITAPGKSTAQNTPSAPQSASPTTAGGLASTASAPASAAPAKSPPIAVAATPRELTPAPRAVASASRSSAPAPRGRPAAPAAAVVPQVSTDLASAYQSLEKGQLNDAERLYRQALAAEPRSVDAMVGLGATLTQQNRADAATQMYMRVLEIDPRNSYAQAGLLSIGGRADPQAAEARLKQLISREPSAYLYFTLGNLYAEQNQWSAAQGAYFQAVNMAPDNPDYAFNLAIGLEHLSQPRLALDYYRRAVSIAQARGNAQFALAPVQARIRSLETALAERP